MQDRCTGEFQGQVIKLYSFIMQLYSSLHLHMRLHHCQHLC